jgi:hypothetical protein
MNDFLKLEYEQCLKLVCYYDERHQSLVRYACSLSSAIPSVLLALWNIKDGSNQYFWLFSTLISFATTISLLSIFTVLTQTRLYFVYPTRQVNAIRNFLLQNCAAPFLENQMYLDTKFNAFKWLSTHTILNAFIALQIGVFSGLTLFSYLFHEKMLSILYFSLLLAIAIATIVFSISSWYLYTKSKYHPDISIHNN